MFARYVRDAQGKFAPKSGGGGGGEGVVHVSGKGEKTDTAVLNVAYGSAADKLSDDQYDAVHIYASDDGYAAMNTVLRGKTIDSFGRKQSANKKLSNAGIPSRTSNQSGNVKIKPEEVGGQHYNDKERKEFKDLNDRYLGEGYTQSDRDQYRAKLKDFKEKVAKRHNEAGGVDIDTLPGRKYQTKKTPTKKNVNDRISDMDAAFSSGGVTSDTPYVVHRGTSQSSLGEFKKGDTIREPGYMSTSLNKKATADEFAGTLDDGVVLHITVRPGTPVIGADGDNAELVLPRNTALKYISDAGTNEYGQREINVEVVE